MHQHPLKKLLLSLLLLVPMAHLGDPGLRAQAASLSLPNTGFYYQAQEPLRYETLKQRWFEAHPQGLPTLAQLEALALLAHQESTGLEPVWLPLKSPWRLYTGPKPWVLTPKVEVVNDSTQAALNLHIKHTLSACFGVWYAHGTTAILNLGPLLPAKPVCHALKSTLSPVCPLAGKQRRLVALPPLSLLGLLQAYPDRWPNTLALKLQLFQGVPTKTTKGLAPLAQHTLALTLKPDYMALPIYLY